MNCLFKATLPVIQVELRIAMLTLVVVLDQSTWMMLLVLQVLVSYWSVLAGQSCHITVFILLMLVWGVKVLFKPEMFDAATDLAICLHYV